MAHKKTRNDNVMASARGFLDSSATGRWFFKYRWHWAFWIVFFFYAYITDYISYPYYVYPAKEVLIFVTHPVFLFYGYVYCLNRFSNKTSGKLAVGLLRFVVTLGIFWSVRILLNYYIYPALDVARGLEKENLVTHDFIINGCIWCIDYLIKAGGYFYLMKYLKKQKETQELRIEKVEQEKLLLEKQIEEERIRQQQQEYERREAMFINIMHEIKTPVTLINVYISDLLDKYGAAPELEVVQSNVNKLSRDITNLFDLERFRHGVEMFNHNQRVDFSILLNNIYDLFVPYCSKKGIRLSKAIQDRVLISADPTALTRIVNNLIENAIKYSPSDTEVLITLSAERGVVSFAICDQGQGIAKEDLETIFIPYHLLNKTKKNFQGMGLGLPMVNNIVETLDGEISINSNEQGGITVTVLLPVGEKLPLAEMEQPDMYVGTIQELEPIGDAYINDDTPIVLVIEDNHQLNDYLVRKLGRRLNVRSALNGTDALAKIKKELPDLIISDVMMDNMDGFEFAKIIKETPSLSHLPIIFLTAKTTDIDKMKGLALGAIDYIQKPFFTTDELITKIESLLNYAQKREKKLYSDMYKTMKMMSRNNNWPQELIADDTSIDQKCSTFKFTNRETEIAKLLVAGKSAREIAEVTFISERTVNAHTRNLYEKAGITNKTELIHLLLKNSRT